MRLEDRFLKNWYRLRNRAQELLRTDMPREEALEILLAEFVRMATPEPAKQFRMKPKKEKERREPQVAELQLGRAYGRIDPPARLTGQLSALNLLMHQLLHTEPENISRHQPRVITTTRLRS